MSSPDVMPIDWSGPAHGLRVMLAPTDEFGMPMEKRGFSGGLPHDPLEFEAFADDLGKLVRETVLHILQGNRERGRS